jgi:hypothetical protein
MTALMWAVLALTAVIGWFMVGIERDLGRIAKTLEALEQLLSKKFREENR